MTTGWAKAVSNRSSSKTSRPLKFCGALDAEERPASPDEKAALVKYVGWGAMPQVFDVDSANWRKEQIQLSEILSDEEHRSARATTLNAHYTSPTVIRAMYQAAQRFGFHGGQILEPACGIGHFIGLMPEEMLRQSTITGVEIDPLTARIAKTLYSDADIRAEPFEKSKLTDESFDLAISNVPFGDYTVHDPRWNELQVSHPRLFLRRCAGQGAAGRSDDARHVAAHARQAGFDPARDARRQSGIARRNPVCQTMPSRKMPARKSPPTS